MARKVKPDQFQQAIQDILRDFGNDVEEGVKEAVKVVVKQGAKEMKASASGSFGGTGRYAKGWTSMIETGRLSAQGAIYNQSVPGLPHLLEFGHAKVNGGRVGGVSHIEPVEQETIEMFEKALRGLI